MSSTIIRGGTVFDGTGSDGRRADVLDATATTLRETCRKTGAQVDTAVCDVRDADALIIRTRTRCDGRLLAGSRVRLIATATIG